MDGTTTATMTEKLTAFVSNMSTVGDAILGEIPSVSEVIQGDPMLFFTVGFLFIGGVIGIFGRLLSRR